MDSVLTSAVNLVESVTDADMCMSAVYESTQDDHEYNVYLQQNSQENCT